MQQATKFSDSLSCLLSFVSAGTMFTGATKIVKPEGQEADEFEQTVAQELFNLEVRSYTKLILQLYAGLLFYITQNVGPSAFYYYRSVSVSCGAPILRVYSYLVCSTAASTGRRL